MSFNRPRWRELNPLSSFINLLLSSVINKYLTPFIFKRIGVPLDLSGLQTPAPPELTPSASSASLHGGDSRDVMCADSVWMLSPAHASSRENADQLSARSDKSRSEKATSTPASARGKELAKAGSRASGKAAKASNSKEPVIARSAEPLPVVRRAAELRAARERRQAREGSEGAIRPEVYTV